VLGASYHILCKDKVDFFLDLQERRLTSTTAPGPHWCVALIAAGGVREAHAFASSSTPPAMGSSDNRGARMLLPFSSHKQVRATPPRRSYFYRARAGTQHANITAVELADRSCSASRTSLPGGRGRRRC